MTVNIIISFLYNETQNSVGILPLAVKCFPCVFLKGRLTLEEWRKLPVLLKSQTSYHKCTVMVKRLQSKCPLVPIKKNSSGHLDITGRMLFNSHIMPYVELKVISCSGTIIQFKTYTFFCLYSEHIGSNLVNFLQHSFILSVIVCFVPSNLTAIVGKLLYLWMILGLHMLSSSRQFYI